MNSKNKGCRGEREFAALCRENGFEEARRGQQFKGGSALIKGCDCYEKF